MAGTATGHAYAASADVHGWGDLGRWAEADPTKDHRKTQDDGAQDDTQDHRAEGHSKAEGGRQEDHQAQDDRPEDHQAQDDPAEDRRAEDHEEDDSKEAPLARQGDGRRPRGRR